MEQTLGNLGNPFEFWEYFSKISEIPRCSGNERLVRDFIKREADSFGLNTKIDKIGNLVIKIPSINKNEVNLRIILQCHLDMVCEKNEGIIHDFSKDPLKLKIIESNGENWLIAQGTTLGADNGVGIAYLLSLMKKLSLKELEFRRLDLCLLFTVEEETDFIGAYQIEKKLIDGDILINLDSEKDDHLIIGCAGGVNTIAIIKNKYENLNDFVKEAAVIKLSITGLIGGHSGLDIHKGRANALKLLVKILWKLNSEISIFINSLNGGNSSNAIPRESHSIFFLEKTKIPHFNKKINKLKSEIYSDFSDIEPNLEILVENIKNFNNKNVIHQGIQNKLLSILYDIPNGPISYDPKVPGLIHTSTNLASIKTKNKSIKIVTSQRSLDEISKKAIVEKIVALLKLENKTQIQHTEEYPNWIPDLNSKLLAVTKETYEILFNKEPIVQALHAGLECGVLERMFPNMDMISIGPTIISVHSPDERLKIESVEKIWRLLIRLLENLQHY